MKCPKCQSDNTDTARFCSNCATSLTGAEEAQPLPTQTIETPREELTTGSTFAGRYQIIEELGKGGMGKVYRALDKELNEEVALKLIKPEIAHDKNTVERFKTEIKLARKISHKSVGRVHELMEEKGLRFITMEYVPGEDLKSFIRRSGQLTISKAISIAQQICDGLSEAHSLGVVHRDLKPNNIMIDRGGNAKIMDFGIARAVKGKSITGPGVMIGTPQYMSPEQVEGKEVDQGSDIYSLGIIIYEMLTDRLPFEGDTPLAVGVKQKTETPKEPKSFNERIPDDLNRLVLKCLEKEKELRYQSADNVRSELERLEQGLPTTDRITPTEKARTSKEITVKFNVKKVFIPALILLAVIIAAVFLWRIIFPTPSPQNSVAVLPFQDMSPGKDQGHLAEGIPDILINALSRIEGLSVPGRISSFSLREEQNIEKIGQKLGVETLLEGSIQASNRNILIVVRLINVEDGFQIWSEEYQKTMDDIFSVQEDIAQSVMKALKIEFQPEKKGQLTRIPTDSSEAYNLYLQGQFLFRKRTSEGFSKALEYFEQAASIEPNFALPYVGIADSYLLLGAWGLLAPQDSFPKSEKYAKHALAIDGTIGEAYTTLASVRAICYWDWDGAEKNYRRSIDLNPNYTTAHHWYAVTLNKLGRFEDAIRVGQRALELDPLNMAVRNTVIASYYYKGEYEKALELCIKAKEIDPYFGATLMNLGLIYEKKKLFDESIVELEKVTSLYPGLYRFWGALGYVYATAGRRDDALNIIKKMKNSAQESFISSYNFAIIYAGLKDNDKAFEYLERAYLEKDDYISALKVDRAFENIRSDPRYKDLLMKMNLQ